MNTDNILIRCSSLGCLFTEPQSKADKEAGLLSKTAKSHLVEVYVRELWGMERNIQTKQMQKGTEAEPEAITLLSRLEKRFYQKNEERKSNDYITGLCDIDDEETDTVTDTKCAWDAYTFMPNLISPINSDYAAQIQGYLWLWGRKRGRIATCLVSTPDSIVEGEKYRLLRQMDVATEESPEFLKEWDKQLRNYKFDHIRPELRVIIHEVERDEEFIEKIPAKVERAREFLSELHQKHITHNKQPQYA